MTIEPEPLLTLSEAAADLHVSAQTLRRWVSKGLIHNADRPFRGPYRFSRTELTRVKARLKARGPGRPSTPPRAGGSR